MSWEIDLVRLLQSVPGLVPPMAVFSALGSPAFYLAFIAVLAWWRERRFAFEIGALIVVAATVNDLVKLLVHAPRPYWVTTEIVPYETQASFGFPSAHAQLAVAVWGLVALRIGRPAVTLVLGVLVLLVGLSRLVLGVHFPVDVVGGYLIGLGVLLAYVLVRPDVGQTARRMTPRTRVLAALALSVGAIVPSSLAAVSLEPWVPSVTWTGPIEGLAPVSIEYTLIVAGLGLGLVLGGELDGGCRSFRSAPAGLAGTVFGLGVLGLLWFGVGLLLPPIGLEAGLGIYLRAAAIGVWCMAGAPAVFCRLGLLAGSGARRPT